MSGSNKRRWEGQDDGGRRREGGGGDRWSSQRGAWRPIDSRLSGPRGGDSRDRERSRDNSRDGRGGTRGGGGYDSRDSGRSRDRQPSSHDVDSHRGQVLPPPPPVPGKPSNPPARHTPPPASSSLAQDAAKVLRQRALAAAGLKEGGGDAGRNSRSEEVEDGELPQARSGEGAKPKHAHVPIVWNPPGAAAADKPASTDAAAVVVSPPVTASRGTPTPTHSARKPPLPTTRSPLVTPDKRSPMEVQGVSPLSRQRLQPSPAHSAGPQDPASEVELIKERQREMGHDPDAPVPLKSSPSEHSSEDDLAKEMQRKVAAASLVREPDSHSGSPEAKPQPPKGSQRKASRWMDDDNEEVEQPRVQPTEPEDEVAAMRELNNKELEDVENEDESDNDSDIGRPDMSPVRREPDMLQECRSVFLYEKIRKISEGTYGVVYKAKDVKTEEIVALKRVKMVKEAYKEGFPRTAIREMNILVQFHHPNIVNVSEVVVGKKNDEIYMVMEYMEHDLKYLMENKMKHPFSVSEVKQLMQQLLMGTAYLHENWILHRDLKTSNILYNNKGQLKVCDFGLARQFAKDPNDDSDYEAPIYTNNVVTLWYRAPELLLGSKVYSTPLDVWSCGCIMAELLNKKGLFEGKGELDQISKIFSVLGYPTEKIWPGFSKLPVASKLNLAGGSVFNNLRSKFPKAAFAGGPCLSDMGFDLLNRMLTYDPSKRITCKEALEHEWFRENPLPKDLSLMPTFPVLDDTAEKARRANTAQAIASAINANTLSGLNK